MLCVVVLCLCMRSFGSTMLEGWLGVMHKDVCGACGPGGIGTLPLAFGLS